MDGSGTSLVGAAFRANADIGASEKCPVFRISADIDLALTRLLPAEKKDQLCQDVAADRPEVQLTGPVWEKQR